MFVSIIIPTYNRAHSIGDTIESLLKQNYPKENYEIIVCDNHSTDNVKAVVQSYVEAYGEERVRYLYEGRQGVHYARNTAAKAARGDILYFTDDDMLADVNLLKELIPVFARDRRIGCATGRVLPKWESQPPKWIKKYCNNSLLSLNDLGRKTFIKDYDMGVFSCHEAIRREAFWETGGFHPEYCRDVYLGDGETGLNQDILKRGWLMAYVGKAKIYHMIPQKRMTQCHINRVMANNGNAFSYSEYRSNAFDKKDLVRRYADYLRAYIRECAKITKRSLRGESSLRFIIAVSYFYKARASYDYRVVNDKKFRKMVTTDNWLA